MFTYNKDIQVKEAGEGVTRKVLSYSSNLMICELNLQQGAVIAEHAHPDEQITYIISGKCSYTVAGETKEVGCGDSVLILGDVPHSLTVLEEMKVIDVFSPAREDFVG